MNCGLCSIELNSELINYVKITIPKNNIYEYLCRNCLNKCFVTMYSLKNFKELNPNVNKVDLEKANKLFDNFLNIKI